MRPSDVHDPYASEAGSVRCDLLPGRRTRTETMGDVAGLAIAGAACGPRRELDGPGGAVAFDQRLDLRRDRVPLQIRAFFGLPLRAPDPALARAVAMFQDASRLPVTGVVDAATLHAMRTAGFQTRAWFARLDQHDAVALQAVRESARDPLVGGSEEGVRHVIAAVALMQIGSVLAIDRGDGRKFGGQRLVEYHRDLGAPVDEVELRGARPLTGPWRAVIAAWCVSIATGRGGWRFDLRGGRPALPWTPRCDDPSLVALQPGDLVARDGHDVAVVVARSSAGVECVGGDGHELRRQTMAFDEIGGYYTAIGEAIGRGIGEASAARADGWSRAVPA